MTDNDAHVDRINREAMQHAVLEYDALEHEGLNAQERAGLELVATQARGGRLLDLGVGAGRTVGPLRKFSTDYVGVDYMQEMVEHCRRKYPGVRFEQMDARAMTAFAPASFDVVFFSCNGICMVDHAGRLAILSEVLRVLAPGGAFVFSSTNRNSPQFEAAFRFPPFQRSLNPAKLAVRSGRFVGQTLLRARNRLRLRPLETRTPEYAVINDVCHHYSTMMYFIDIPSQIRQLAAAGFSSEVRVFDLRGRPAEPDCRDGTLSFVTHKPASR